MITVSQQTQHDPVLIETGDDVQCRVPPRNDRYRAGIVRVGLVDPPVVQQAHPGRQLRRHINHVLTGRDELLGEHRAQQRRALDRPHRAARTRPPTPNNRFHLRATPPRDLTETAASLESQPHGDRAFLRHTRSDPRPYEYRSALASHPLSEAIYLFDDDEFVAHNASCAPGAARSESTAHGSVRLISAFNPPPSDQAWTDAVNDRR